MASQSLNSLQKFLERLRERVKYKDGSVMDFVEQTNDVVAADLLTHKIIYHEICYANIANTAKLEQAKSRVAMFISTKGIQRIFNIQIHDGSF